jgi:cytochrome c peroxidase
MNKFLIIVFGLLLWSCKKDQKPEYTSVDDLRAVYSAGDQSMWPDPQLHESIDKESFTDIGVLPALPENPDNPYTQSKYELGKALFFERRLSKSNKVACATCHVPSMGWTDHKERSFGHDQQTGKRNAMTILNAAYADKLFWDGRALSLEHQAMFPIADPVEMNEKLPIAVKTIRDLPKYQILFENAFGADQINMQNIQKAIAVFERQIVSPPSKFDKFISGKSELFTDSEVRGLHLFRTKAQCINCHNTPYFSDNAFHNDGLGHFGTKNEDLGLFYVTGNKEDIGKFRTPTLREASMTGPWMHTGFFKSLEDVITYYNLGNPMPVSQKYFKKDSTRQRPQKADALKPLELTPQEQNDLLAFLETLTTEGVTKF